MIGEFAKRSVFTTLRIWNWPFAESSLWDVGTATSGLRRLDTAFRSNLEIGRRSSATSGWDCGQGEPTEVGTTNGGSSFGSGAGDCAPAPSHTTGQAVFSHPAVERSGPLHGGRKI